MKVIPPRFTDFLTSFNGSSGVFTTSGLVNGCPKIKRFAPSRRRLRAFNTVSCPTTGSIHVLRGGAWINDANETRSANRNFVGADVRVSSLVGFRIVQEVN